MQGQQENSENPLELDLPGANCTTFSLNGEFVASENVHQLIDELNREARIPADQRTRGEVARYAAKYSVDYRTVGIAGHLESMTSPDEGRFSVHIRYFQASDDLPDPPEGFKPIEELLQVAADLIGEIAIDCEATFVYQVREGFRSRVALPAPLLLSDQSSPLGLTHIESIALSHREGGTLTHSVVVYSTNEDNDEDNGIGHNVEFPASSILTINNIKQLFEVARRLSMSLMELRSEEPQ